MPSSEDNFKNARYIRTISGRKFHLNGIDPVEININDIAHALSHICRFTGHTARFYSVAEHSVFVKNILRRQGVTDPWFLMTALLHDSAEAYIADIAAPFKGALANYQDIEERIWNRIAFKFGVNPVMPSNIKDADWAALFAEATELQPHSEIHTWQGWDKWGPLGENLQKMGMVPKLTPPEAAALFLHEFRTLLTKCGDRLISPSKYPEE